MTPQELKSSILQLAIQGKLVEQRPEEGTGAELLREILAAKNAKNAKGGARSSASALMTGGTGATSGTGARPSRPARRNARPAGPASPAGPTPVSPEEQPFEIPESWVWVRIGDVFNLQAGKNIKSELISQTPSPTHRYPCYGGNGCRGYVADYNRSGHYALIGRQGALCGNINFAEGRFYATEHAVVVELFAETSVIWCGYFLQALNLNQYATATAQPGLAVSNINQVLIPLPPLAEQKRIVAKIEELLPYVERYEKAWSRLEEFNRRFPEDMRKSVLQMAIQGKLVEQRPEEGTGEELLREILRHGTHKTTGTHRTGSRDSRRVPSVPSVSSVPVVPPEDQPFEIPESWVWVRLGDVIDLLSGTDFKPEEYNDKAHGIPYITGASSLSNEGVLVNRWTETPRVIAEEGDVLLVCKGSGYGKTVICDVARAHIARQIMAVKKTAFFDMEYIRYFLMANIQMIKSKGQGVIPGVDRGSILTMAFPLPPLAEQKRIVAKLEEILPLCERLKGAMPL